MRDVLRVGAVPAENAEDRLNEEGRLDQPPVDEMRQIVEVPDIVAFELEAGAATLAQILQDPLDVLESVAEDEVPRHFEVLALPLVFPVDRKSTRLNSSHSQISYAVF